MKIALEEGQFDALFNQSFEEFETQKIMISKGKNELKEIYNEKKSCVLMHNTKQMSCRYKKKTIHRSEVDIRKETHRQKYNQTSRKVYCQTNKYTEIFHMCQLYKHIFYIL